MFSRAYIAVFDYLNNQQPRLTKCINASLTHSRLDLWSNKNKSRITSCSLNLDKIAANLFFSVPRRPHCAKELNFRLRQIESHFSAQVSLLLKVSSGVLADVISMFILFHVCSQARYNLQETVIEIHGSVVPSISREQRFVMICFRNT